MIFSVKTILFLFIFGALLGPAADLFHNLSGTSAYAHPYFMGLAFYVPFLFGSATAVVALSHVWMDLTFNQPKRVLSWNRVALGLMSFLCIYYVSGYLNVEPDYKFLILGVMAWAVWFVFDRTAFGFGLAVMTAAGGCFVEALQGYWKVFYYLEPDVWGLPYWLPFLYMVASVAVGNLGRKLYELSKIRTA